MKKRFAALLLAAALCLLVGCTKAPALPEADYPLELTFSSGAGAWRSTLNLNADGTFEGFYSDSNMGETGEGYPNGTVYTASFTGSFLPPEQVDEHSYRLQLDSLTLSRPAGEEWIKEGILYVAAGAFGLEDGHDFVFYTPDTPVSELDEDMLMWWPGSFITNPPETLSCYALWNVETDAVFFTYSDALT